MLSRPLTSRGVLAASNMRARLVKTPCRVLLRGQRSLAKSRPPQEEGISLPAFFPCAGSISAVSRSLIRRFRFRNLATEAAEAAEANPSRIWAMRAGHAAFIMLASMYLMTDMVLLRVLGIVANGFDMFYCYLVAEVPLWLNIRWGAFYVLVNVVQLGQISKPLPPPLCHVVGNGVISGVIRA